MGKAHMLHQEKVDLVELGFCHLVQVTEGEGQEDEGKAGEEARNSKGYWRMDMSEPLAAVTAKVYLEQRKAWRQDSVVEQLMLKVDLPSPLGSLWDIYIPTALRRLFRPDKKLAEHPLLSEITSSLPASFFAIPQIVCVTEDGTVSKVTDYEDYKVRRGDEGFRLVDFAENPRGFTFFLPEDGAGPDVSHFVQLGGIEKEIWFRGSASKAAAGLRARTCAQNCDTGPHVFGASKSRGASGKAEKCTRAEGGQRGNPDSGRFPESQDVHNEGLRSRAF